MRVVKSDMWVEWADLRGACTAPPYWAVLSLSLMHSPAAVGSGFLVDVLVSMRYLPVHGSMEGGSGRGLRRAVLLGACAASPYDAHRCLVRPRFPVFVEVGLHTHGSGGKESFWGSGIGFKCLGISFTCLEFFGLEISLGSWRKAVSRIAAPRGPVFGHH